MAMSFVKSIPTARPFKIYEGEIDLDSVGATGTAMAEVDLTIAGLESTDMVVSFQPMEAGLSLGIGSARVSADNTLSVIFVNTDDAAVDEGAMDFRLIICPAI